MTCITYSGLIDRLRAKKDAELYAKENNMKIIDNISTGFLEGYYKLERC